MKHNKLLALLLICAILSGCVPKELPSDSETSSSTIIDMTDSEIPTESETEEIIQYYSLFTEEALATQPETISTERAEQLFIDLDALLATKNYSEDAKTMIRTSMGFLLESYPTFESMFLFLDPPDTEEYIRMYFMAPLENMVDEFIYKPGLRDGYSNDREHIMYVSQNEDPYIDAEILVHELWHMVVCEKHYVFSSPLYNYLSEGGATTIQLALAGSEHYMNLSDAYNSSHSYLDNKENFLIFGKLGYNNYSFYSSLWFRLLSLTDFDTMALFFQPKGEYLIRENLIERYGEIGGDFYDALELFGQEFEQEHTFETAFNMESMYLQLLKERLSEVDSPSDMVSYLQLYRVMQFLMGSECISYYTGTPFNSPLDYKGFDLAVTEAVLNWDILNSATLTKEETYALARCISSVPRYSDHKSYLAAIGIEPYSIASCTYGITILDKNNLKILFQNGDTHSYWRYYDTTEKYSYLE